MGKEESKRGAFERGSPVLFIQREPMTWMEEQSTSPEFWACVAFWVLTSISTPVQEWSKRGMDVQFPCGHFYMGSGELVEIFSEDKFIWLSKTIQQNVGVWGPRFVYVYVFQQVTLIPSPGVDSLEGNCSVPLKICIQFIIIQWVSLHVRVHVSTSLLLGLMGTSLHKKNHF